MPYKLLTLALLLAALALPACGGGGGGGGGYSPPAGGGGTPVPAATLAPQTIGLAIPSGFIGVMNDGTFGLIGGFTQVTYSQSLAFQAGTTVTILNLGSANHTLNVLSTTAFPASGPATTAASGTSVMNVGYATGPIAPGASMTATLGAAGTYYLGCAYHYLPAPQMRTALIATVAANPVPGPQATPGPAGSSGGGGGGGCHSSYC